MISGVKPNLRRFACTSCGACCNKGPEMELSEAAGLADRFITSVLFKVHSLPIDERSERAAAWWRDHGSRIPLRPALEEERRHLSLFASRRRSERRKDRQIFLTISAIVDEDGRGRCPALEGDRCGIYDARPLTCRTVPMHYSRPPSVLASYIDRFAATPGYRCDVTQEAPAILDGNAILDPTIRRHRDEAVALAKSERAWKERMLTLMDDAEQARAARLPTYDAVLANSNEGYATMLPMMVAWRVARTEGILSPDAYVDLCRKQAILIRDEISRRRDHASPASLRETLVLYETELSRAAGLAGAFSPSR